MDVFDESQLKDSVVGDFPDYCRNPREPGQLRRAPTSFARNQLEQATKSTDQKRLNDPTGPNRLGQFVQFSFVEMSSRLMPVRIPAWYVLCVLRPAR